MGKRDARVNAYIAGAAPFARPILTQLRAVVHEGCPDVVEEIKWGHPHFTYKGLLCNMAAFKQHCAFGFWKKPALDARVKALRKAGADAMGSFGRIASPTDLPARGSMLALVKEAAALNDAGIKTPARKRTPTAQRALEVPDDFIAAVRKNPKALQTFEHASYSFRKEYLAWVAEAKSTETRLRRIMTSVAQMAAGKGKNWKYERC